MTEFAAFWSTVVRKHFPAHAHLPFAGRRGRAALRGRFLRPGPGLRPVQSRLRVTNEGSDYAAELLRHPRGRLGQPGLRPGLRLRAGRARDRRRQRGPDLQRHGLRRRAPLLLQGQHPAKRPRPWKHSGSYIGFLQRRTPVVHAALYLPKTTWALDDSGRAHGRSLLAARELRERVDCELLDRTTLATPLAGRMRVLAVSDADVRRAGGDRPAARLGRPAEESSSPAARTSNPCSARPKEATSRASRCWPPRGLSLGSAMGLPLSVRAAAEKPGRAAAAFSPGAGQCQRRGLPLGRLVPVGAGQHVRQAGRRLTNGRR